MIERPKNLPASVRAKLFNLARRNGQTLNDVLPRYGMERLLYRLTQSPHGAQFVLKGGLLFYGPQFPLSRLTRDIDLQADQPVSVTDMEHVFREVCVLPVEPDGVQFDPLTVRGEPISAEFRGVRIQLFGELAQAELKVQIDISFGNVITPEPNLLEFPTLLPANPPRLRAYPYATILAEKLEAIVSLATENSRLKDHYDLWLLALYEQFDGQTLRLAIQNTFQRRATPLPVEVPIGLTDLFAHNNERPWQVLLKRYRVALPNSEALAAIMPTIRAFLLPPLHAAAADDQTFTAHWPAGGPWQP